MAQAVPARKANLDEVEVSRLRELTAELTAAKPEAAADTPDSSASSGAVSACPERNSTGGSAARRCW
jgi:hypothetical protein